MNTRLAFAVLAIAALSTACQQKAVKPAAPPPAAVSDSTGATRYDIDSAASSVHVLVYRGGTMARLGHNHVVSSSEVRGFVLLHPELSRSRVELTMPVGTLSVDDPKARATEGEDFSAEVPQDARDGTRKNLLRAEVLDGERFAAISMKSVAVTGSRERPTLTMRITIKDATRDVQVPAIVQQEGKKLTASGEFAIKQTDFGITPFSVGLGTLQVVDQLKVKFRIVAASS